MVKIIAVCKSEERDTEKEAVVGCVGAGDNVKIKNHGQ